MSVRPWKTGLASSKTLAVLCTACLITGSVVGQQANRQTRPADRSQTSRELQLVLPGAERMLRIQVDHPAEMRVDQPFEMKVNVTNLSDDVSFHDVKIGHLASSALQVESAKLEPRAQQPDSSSQQTSRETRRSLDPQRQPQEQAAQQQQEQQQERQEQQREQQQERERQQEAEEQQSQGQRAEEEEGQQAQEQEREQPRDEERQQQAQARQGQAQQQGQEAEQQEQHAHAQQQQAQPRLEQEGQQGQPEGEYARVWTIDHLEPGETRTLTIQASSSQEGSVKSCLALVSFTPSLCITTKFVKPELEIVKRAPEEAHICDVINFEYFVKNAGTGTIDEFIVEDALDEGLQTIEGDDQLRFRVEGGLEAGEVRKFVAKLRATRGGEYSSRAVAIDPKGQKTRSASVTTRVLAPELAVAVSGPDTLYVDRPATYTIRVTNHGEAPAESASLLLRYPDSLTIARATEPQPSDQAVERSQEASQQQQARQQKLQAQEQEQQQRQQQLAQQPAPSNQRQARQQQPQREQRAEQTLAQDWDLGTLDAGETRIVRVTFRSRDGGAVKLDAQALSYCEQNKELRTSFAQASLRSEILSLPALLISVIDEKDPVPAEDELMYRVIVANEGTAPDEQVQVTVEMPEGFEFVKAEGPSEVQAEGNQLTFGEIESIEPGQKLVWRLRVKTSGEGDVALAAKMRSAGMTRTVTAEEPTTVFVSTGAETEVSSEVDGQQPQRRPQQEEQQSEEQQEEEQQDQQREQQEEQQEEEQQAEEEEQEPAEEPSQEEPEQQEQPE